MRLALAALISLASQLPIPVSYAQTRHDGGSRALATGAAPRAALRAQTGDKDAEADEDPGEKAPACWDRARDPKADCSDPGKLMARVFKAVNESSTVSEALAKLALDKDMGVGMTESFSKQASTGKFDPRVLIFTPCTVLSFSLFGKTLELAVTRQRADPRLAGPLPASERMKADEEGEIFAEFTEFPRDKARAVGPEKAVVRLDGVEGSLVGDTHGCVRCHNDAGYGQREVQIAGKRVVALVQPYKATPGKGPPHAMGGLFCVPQDTTRLYQCLCEGNVGIGCVTWFDVTEEVTDNPARAEACARLRIVREAGLPPACQYDPRRQPPDPDGHPHRCRANLRH